MDETIGDIQANNPLGATPATDDALALWDTSASATKGVTVAELTAATVAAVVDTDGAFTADSDDVVPSQKAVKTYGDANWGGGGGGGITTIETTPVGVIGDHTAANHNLFYQAVIPTDTLVIDTMEAWCASYGGSANTVEMGIYDASFNKVASATISVSATGRFQVDLGSDQTLNADTLYYFALLDQTNDSGTSFYFAYGSGTFTELTGNKSGLSTMPSTITSQSSNANCLWIRAFHS